MNCERSRGNVIAESDRATSCGGKWKKVLYARQPFDDNHVDAQTFLSSLVTNENLLPYDYWAIVHDSASVIQAITAVILCGLVFHHSWRGAVDATTLMTIDVSLCIAAVGIRLGIGQHDMESNDISDGQQGKSCLQQRRTAVYMSLRNGLILVGILLGLTPILRSLTQAFSDDTILFLSIVCLMLHVLSQDYAFINNYHDRFSGMASLNLAIFATVMLASRLDTNAKVRGPQHDRQHPGSSAHKRSLHRIECSDSTYGDIH